MSTPGTPVPDSPRPETFREAVRAELVRQLYRQAPGSMVALLIVAGILAYSLWNTAPREWLIGWLLAVIGVSAFRLAQIGAFFRRDPPTHRMPRWAVASAMGSALVGCVWAIACFLFLDPQHPVSLITITVILMGLSAGSVVNLSSYLPSFGVVVGPSMGALIGVLIWHGDAASNTVALLAGVASIAYFVGARNTHRLLTESLQLGFENLALRREAEEKTALLEATLRNMRQGISLTDAEGRLRMWNPQFVDLMRVPDPGPGGETHMHEVLSGARPPLTLGEARRVEYRSAGGTTVIEVTQNAMPDGGRVVTYTDITELKLREAALETARRNAEQANASKTRFLAAASHDLRQPVHALGLLFATLSDRVQSESTASLLDHIGAAVEAVESMLDSLLDISKLDAGVVQPDMHAMDLGARLRLLDNEHQPVAKVTGNTLRIHPTRIVVRSDPAMLHRILGNLISNALRYTHNGRVAVGVRRRGDSVQVDIYDTGPGIPADALEDIFLEFHQLGNPERDRRKGLGLGLAIVRRLADLLGHKIEVRSTVGRGTRFSVTLPLSGDAPLRALPTSNMIPRGVDLAGRRVLVLDDDRAVLNAMRGLLERWGCEVSTASSPEEAKASLESAPETPDVLIVDYRLRNEASGIEVAGALRKFVGSSIPVLVITGDTAPERLREAKESGYPLLHKPVKPAQLRSMLHHLIGGPRVSPGHS